MHTKKPALIGRDPRTKRWLAWNEDGSIVGRAIGYLEWTELNRKLLAWGYEHVSPNSRIAATIRDKLATRAREKGWV